MLLKRPLMATRAAVGLELVVQVAVTFFSALEFLRTNPLRLVPAISVGETNDSLSVVIRIF